VGYYLQSSCSKWNAEEWVVSHESGVNCPIVFYIQGQNGMREDRQVEENSEENNESNGKKNDKPNN